MFWKYEDEWLQLGLEDESLKCGSPASSGTHDFTVTMAARSCPSPLSHIPTREPYSSEPPPKLSPVSTGHQTFITLSNTRIPPVSSGPSQPVLQTSPQMQSSELTSIQYELNSDLSVLTVPSSSPLLPTKPTELQFAQPSISGLQQNGDFASFVQLEQREKRAVIHHQQHPPGCVQAVNGQWFVQAQVQHVQTSAGTVIAVVPNFCRPQAQSAGSNQNMSQVQQVSQPQLVAHPIGNGQAVGTAQPTIVTTPHLIQTHPHHQIPQHSQQIMHTARIPNSLTVSVAAGVPQQGQSVMQHLLSQPTISRAPQVQPGVQTITSAAVATKKRNAQPRNGRRKNANQGGTLGAVLAKANKLAAASSTDASLNQLLPPSHGIEMRLSVQNSEQVASLSKEISRLQNLQATYNIDHSAEIKELENKRAQIFFEALAQQHKDKDLLLAVNPRPLTLTTHTRQRNNIRNNHSNANATVVVHQVQPSTSYEHQTQPVQRHQQQLNYETSNARVPVSYHSSYQLSSQYVANHETYQNTSFAVRNNNQMQQVSATQFNSYRPAASQSLVQLSQAREGYIQSIPNVSHQPAIMQSERPISHHVIQEMPCDPPPPPVPLLPPPSLRSSIEAASCIAEKRNERTIRLCDYFQSLHSSIQYSDLDSPFFDLSDVLQRLLPFHAFCEPDLSPEILDTYVILTSVDYNCLRHMVYLTGKKNSIEQRIRTILFNEAMVCFPGRWYYNRNGYNRAEECLLLSLDAEYERRLLEEEKRMTALHDKRDSIAISSVCTRVNIMDLEKHRRELISKGMPKLNFEYHEFSESEIAARQYSPISKCSNGNFFGSSSSIFNENIIHLDFTDKMQEIEEALPADVDSFFIDIVRNENDNETNENKTPNILNDWITSIPSPVLTSSLANYTPQKKNNSNHNQKPCSSFTAGNQQQAFIARSRAPSITKADHSDAANSSACTKEMSSLFTTEEYETTENCIPVGNEKEQIKAEIENHASGIARVVDQNMTGTKTEERPPIRLKIALNDGSMRNCLGKTSTKKKKKKKKNRKHHNSTKSHCKEISGQLLSASKSGDIKCTNTGDRDNESHPRLLMRLKRLNNVLSVADPGVSHAPSSHIIHTNEVDEEQEPPLKVPKLKIRLPRDREELKSDSGKTNVNHVSEEIKCKVNRVGINCEHDDADRDKRTSNRDRKTTIVIPRSMIQNAHLTSTISGRPATLNSDAQFSPNSESSNEEEDEQLRAQTDSVISRLNDWSSKRTVSRQADTLSRLVGTAPLVSPVLDRLLPKDSWIFGMNMKNHSTVDTTDTGSSHMLWMANKSRSLKTTVSISKPN
ncbi:unnamed protein product [Thelazia callipaeda]|uniref:GLTSCR1 domain-containing protein n=1 Tax=Thelazia callipaeda TaxID=103827 RepID=A0A0N5D582_THECL|nr:unnamed protein product [Thelazia callipaeda]